MNSRKKDNENLVSLEVYVFASHWKLLIRSIPIFGLQRHLIEL